MRRRIVTAALAAALTLALTASGGLLAAPGARAAEGKVKILWLGQAAVRITSTTGKVIVIDPFLKKNPKTPEGFKNLNALGNVDLVLVTHGHFDHVADAPELSELNNAKMYGPPGLMDTFVSLGLAPAERALRMNKGGIIHPLGPDITITMVRAEHSSEFKWKDPATGKEQVYVGGEPCGWIIELENGFKIYHMGDTGLFGDMKFIGEYYKPDLVLIPIGGHFVMNPEDAAYAVDNFLRPKHAVPIHYGTFPVLKGTPAQFINAVKRRAVQVHPIEPGQELIF